MNVFAAYYTALPYSQQAAQSTTNFRHDQSIANEIQK